MFQLNDDSQHYAISYHAELKKVKISSRDFDSDIPAFVFGWGTRDPHYPNIIAKQLQQLQVKTISNDECKKRFMSNKIEESHICAVSPVGYFVAVSTLIYNNS